jgi:WD40 repeat protein
MYPGLSGSPIPDRDIKELDVLKDNFLFDCGRTFMALPANDTKNAVITLIPNTTKKQHGLKQPRVKAPGAKVAVALFSQYEPTVLFVGTTGGIATFWDLPPNGLKGDASKPASQLDLKDEIKCAAFHPIATTVIAIGLRNGHVQIYDKTLSAPLVDLPGPRALNSVTFSDDGKLVYALYIDMVLKIFDVRTKAETAEVKVTPSRGLGYLAPLSGARVAVSFVLSGKQELRIYGGDGAEVATRQVGLGGTPLGLQPHFTGLILALASRENSLRVLDGNTLADVATWAGPGPIACAGIELVKPDPDGATVFSASVVLANNTITRVAFAVESAPALFEAGCPTYEPNLTAEAWAGGTDGAIAVETLSPTVKPEEKAAEEKAKAGPQTYYRFLQTAAEPPAKYWIDLPVGQAPNAEFNDIATNGTQFAFVGAGATPPVVVMNLDKPTLRYPGDYKQVIVDPHGSGVGVIEFCAHNPSLLVTGGDDCKAKIWSLPKTWTEPLRQPEVTQNHGRRVGIAKFSQISRNLLLTATAAPELGFWDLNTYQRLRNFDKYIPAPIQDAEQNEFSSVVYTIVRDGNLLAFDPRAQAPEITTVMAHKNGGRHRRILNIPDYDMIATFGSSDRGERQVSVWDRKELSKPLKTLDLDTATGSLLPMYQEGSGLIFLGGKGDGHIRFIELCTDDRVIASAGVYETSAPERGLCLLPRKGLDIMGCETARMLKLATESMHILHWKVPRTHTELFQDMIFPPIRDTSSPLMEAVDWDKGQNDVWPMIDLQPAGTKKASDILPKFVHTRGSGKYGPLEDEVKPKTLTIEAIIASAPKISTSSDDEKKESDSW